MSAHTFRNPELFEVQQHSEFFRRHLPDSARGYVKVDLDMVLRVYGPQYDTDRVGRFRFVELKYGTARLTQGQINTFKLIDSVLRRGDIEGRYDGFYVINHGDWDEAGLWHVNGTTMDFDDFVAWCEFRLDVPALFVPPEEMAS